MGAQGFEPCCVLGKRVVVPVRLLERFRELFAETQTPCIELIDVVLEPEAHAAGAHANDASPFALPELGAFWANALPSDRRRHLTVFDGPPGSGQGGDLAREAIVVDVR